MEEENLVPIYSAANAVQAQLLRERLAEIGIEAFIINEPLAGGAGELPLGWSTSPRVVVAAHDAEQAREIALSFDRAASERAHAGQAQRPEYDADVLEDQHHAWPRCPQCEHRRLAVCPFCGTAGSNFALGYVGPPGAGEPPPITVACPTCDEVFKPQYYRECENCGHAFADGVALRKPKGLEPVSGPILNARAWTVIGVAIACCLLLTLYFWSLFRD